MTKSEQREVNNLIQYRAAGADAGMLARSVSALIRSAMTSRSKQALMQVAAELGVIGHPEYIC